MVHVTAFFAGLLALLYLALTAHVVRGRYKLRLPLGDGGDAHMNRRIRAHANFAEYVPLALVLMALNELSGMSNGILNFLGLWLVAGRVSHAYSLMVSEVGEKGHIRFRQFGMVSTLSVIGILALAAIF